MSKHLRGNKLVAVGVLIVFALVTGCSATSLVYNNAPWLISGKIDDYFSVSRDQQQQLDQDIQAFAQWHRVTELPRYVRLLSKFSAQFENGLTRDELGWLFDQVSAARIRFAERGIDPASDFLSAISAAQLDHFDREFREHLAEDRDDFEPDPKDRDEADFERLLDTLEDWFGDFDADQLVKLRRISDTFPDNREYRFDLNEQRHREFLQLMRGNPDRNAIESYLYRRFVEPRYTSADQRNFNLRAQRQWQSSLLEIDRLLTTDQRENAVQELNEYRDEFYSLSQQKIDEGNSQNFNQRQK